MSDLTLLLFAHELDSMDEYSCSLPTATTIGKMWKRRSSETPAGWVVGLYAYHIAPTPEEIRRDRHHAGRTRILWFDVVLRHGPAPRVYRAPDWSNFAGWRAERAAERAEAT